MPVDGEEAVPQLQRLSAQPPAFPPNVRPRPSGPTDGAPLPVTSPPRTARRCSGAPPRGACAQDTSEIESDEALRILYDLVASDDVDHVVEGIWAIANFCREDRKRRELIETDGVQMLFNLLRVNEVWLCSRGAPQTPTWQAACAYSSRAVLQVCRDARVQGCRHPGVLPPAVILHLHSYFVQWFNDSTTVPQSPRAAMQSFLPVPLLRDGLWHVDISGCGVWQVQIWYEVARVLLHVSAGRPGHRKFLIEQGALDAILAIYRYCSEDTGAAPMYRASSERRVAGPEEVESHSHSKPHHTTPHHTAPHRTTPHHTTPHHTTPHHTTPHHTTPHHTTPHHTTPHHTTPHHTTPHHTPAQHTPTAAQ